MARRRSSSLVECAGELDLAGGVDELSDELPTGDGDVQEPDRVGLPASRVFALEVGAGRSCTGDGKLGALAGLDEPLSTVIVACLLYTSRCV